jgi:phage terminase small subunit
VALFQLLHWQWNGYPRYHRSRTNLLVHIVAVPLFWLGSVALIAALCGGSLSLVAFGVASLLGSLALQSRGHNLEENPPEPFTNPANAVARILLEQWVTFPRFVLSGGWQRAFRAAAHQDGGQP